MILRKHACQLLLLLLPALTTSLAVDSKGKPGSVQQLAHGAMPPDSSAVPELPPQLAGSKPEKGTKDAPVDGLDGKPHAGPFVESTPTKPKKKPPAGGEDLGPGSKLLPSASTASSHERAATVPENDGVMDDRNREAPRKGTTGTEGGVSEKDRKTKAEEDQVGFKKDRKPDPPKEAPPLPESEQEKILKEKGGTIGKDVADLEKPKGAVGLAKPIDLPDKPHDIPHPVPPTLPKGDLLGTEPPADLPTNITPLPDGEATGVIQPFHSFILSLTMILFSEVGDKTFLVAALMAMRHPRLVVFSAAFSALIAMTVLSAVLGHAVPTLLPERFTHFLAAILFLFFGAKLLREGYVMSPDEGVGEEMKEVEMELEEKAHLARRNSHRHSSISPYALEAGRGRRSRSSSRLPAPARSPSSSSSRSPSPGRSSSLRGLLAGLNNLFSLLLSPAWVQTFVMTFLGEWGDRSQIATIAMAAGQDYWWVTGGAISGHAVCTAAAVIGGRAVAGRVSMRKVTLGGAIAFLAFGVIYLVEAAYSA